MIIVNRHFEGTLTDGYLNSEEQLLELGNLQYVTFGGTWLRTFKYFKCTWKHFWKRTK